jgi:hypothetical protein
LSVGVTGVCRGIDGFSLSKRLDSMAAMMQTAKIVAIPTTTSKTIPK